MAIGEERRLPGGEEFPHVLVLDGLLKEKRVVRLVLFVSDHSGDVDKMVVAVLHREDVHDPLPGTLEVASAHRHNL